MCYHEPSGVVYGRVPGPRVRGDMRRLIFRLAPTLIVAIALWMAWTTTADAVTVSQFMDSQLFKPHKSPITGAMVVNNSKWYGIDVLAQLVVLAAETSFGDPKLGGELARQNNFGCLRYGSAPTKWGALADGKVTVGGKTWYTFPTAQVGMAAFGRFLKIGQGGVLKKALDQSPYDWAAFGKAYYGQCAGLDDYVARLQRLEATLRAKAEAFGVSF